MHPSCFLGLLKSKKTSKATKNVRRHAIFVTAPCVWPNSHNGSRTDSWAESAQPDGKSEPPRGLCWYRTTSATTKDKRDSLLKLSAKVSCKFVSKAAVTFNSPFESTNFVGLSSLFVENSLVVPEGINRSHFPSIFCGKHLFFQVYP